MELAKDVKAYVELRKKLMVRGYARRSVSVAKALKEFKVPKATYYKWKKIFYKNGVDGLLKKHPVADNHPNKIKVEVIEKVVALLQNTTNCNIIYRNSVAGTYYRRFTVPQLDFKLGSCSNVVQHAAADHSKSGLARQL